VAVAVVVVLPWAAVNFASSGRLDLLTGTFGQALSNGLYISRYVGWTKPAGDINLYAEIAMKADLSREGLGAETDRLKQFEASETIALEWIKAHPGTALGLWARNFVLTWYLARTAPSMALHFVLHSLLLTSAAIGARRLWSCGNSRTRDLVVVTALLAIAYSAFHAAIQPGIRYVLPVVPLLALVAAGAFTTSASGTGTDRDVPG
jgi:hypothetical protein